MSLMNQNQMQKHLQNLFEAKCRSYNIYYETYEQLASHLEKLKTEYAKIEGSIQSKEKISDFKNLLNDQNLRESIKILDTSCEIAKLASEISSKIPDLTTEKANLKLDELDDEIRVYNTLFQNVKKTLEIIRQDIFSTISEASDLNVQFDCCNVDLSRTMYKMFVLYFADGYRFNYNRNVIGKSYFPRNFINAYKTKTDNDGSAWFIEEAKGITF